MIICVDKFIFQVISGWMSASPKQPRQLSPELINKINDINGLRQLSCGLLEQVEKFKKYKNDIKDKIQGLKEHETQLTLELDGKNQMISSMQEMISGLLQEKTKTELEVAEKHQMAKKISELENQIKSKSIESDQNPELKSALVKIQNLEEEIQLFKQQKVLYEQTFSQEQESLIQAFEKDRDDYEEKLKSKDIIINELESRNEKLKEQINNNASQQNQDPQKNEELAMENEKLKIEIEDKTRNYEEINNQLSNKINLLNEQLNESQNKHEELNKQLNGKINSLNNQLAEAQGKYDESLNEVSLLKINHNNEINSLKKQLELLQNQRNEDEKTINSLQNSMNENKINFLNQQSELEKSQFNDLRTQIENNNITILKLTKENESKATEIEKLHASIEQESNKANDMSRLVSQYESDKENMNQKLQEAYQNNEKQLNKIAQLKTTINELKAKLNETELSNQQLISENEGKSNFTISLKSELELKIDELNKQILGISKDNSTLMNKLSLVEEEKKRLIEDNKICNQNNAELNELKIENEKLKENYQQALNDLNEEKNKSSILHLSFQELKNKQNEYELANEKIEILNAQLTSLQEDFSKQVSSLESQLVSSDQKVSDLSDELEKSKKSQIDLQDLLERAKSSNQILEQTLNMKMTALVSSETDKEDMRNTMSDLQSKYNSIKQEKELLLFELNQIKEKYEELNKLSNEVKGKNESLASQMAIKENLISELTEKLDHLQDVQKDFSSMQKKYDELYEYRENKEKELSSSELNALLTEKDQTIAKLKQVVQRYVKLDKRKQQQIEDLQKELQDKISNENDKGGVSPDVLDTISSLERKAAELQQRLDSSQANKSVEAKNEMLTKSMEKTNKLYTSLLEENQRLSQELKDERKTKVKPNLIIANSEPILITPQSKPQAQQPQTVNSIQNNSKSTPKKATVPPDDKRLNETYLKRVLLQFFLQDDSKRDSLVPLILELAGCSEQQIETATRQWQRTAQLRSKGTSFFGF